MTAKETPTKLPETPVADDTGSETLTVFLGQSRTKDLNTMALNPDQAEPTVSEETGEDEQREATPMNSATAIFLRQREQAAAEGRDNFARRRGPPPGVDMSRKSLHTFALEDGLILTRDRPS
jgi:hypothetical protein